MSYSDFKPSFQRLPVSVKQLQEGTLDAIVIAIPTPNFARTADALRQIGVRTISLDRAIVEQLQAEYPFLRPARVPASQLWGQRNDLETVGADALLVCHQQLPEDLVYRLTRELFAALPKLAETHTDAAEVDPDLAATTPIPLHPGAARYYREREILQ
jgi:TRAP transporter TAXI family solute receptor